jgi:hypothetical protein
MNHQTKYAIEFIRIWNSSANRREAHNRLTQKLDSNLTYAQMMAKVSYMKYSRGITLKDVPYLDESVDWSAVTTELKL